MWLALYNALLVPIWIALLLARPLLGRQFRERMGEIEVPGSGPVRWIHCASVGELTAVSGLVREMREREPDSKIAISTVTTTGRSRAAELFPDALSFLAPLDIAGCVRRTLRNLRPEVLFIVETELWPNLVSLAHGRGIRVVLLNGRLSRGSLRRYLLLRPFFSRTLRQVEWLFVQTAADREAYLKLGAPEDRISITGTMKSDLQLAAVDRTVLRGSYSIPERAEVFVAGSIRPDEEDEVLRALAVISGSRPSVYFVVAPRHLQRAQRIGRRAEELGMAVRFRSEDRAYKGERILMLDTIGELTELYGTAHVAFVGGSLRPYGGHNVLEPAMWRVPVLFGEFTDNCREEAEDLLSSKGGMRVNGWEDLASAVISLLQDERLRLSMGRSAGRVVEERSGVSARVYQMLKDKGLLERVHAGR